MERNENLNVNTDIFRAVLLCISLINKILDIIKIHGVTVKKKRSFRLYQPDSL